MILQDVLIQTTGALFFCAEAREDGDYYVLPADRTVLIVQQQGPGGQVVLGMVKGNKMLGKPMEIRVSIYGSCLQDVTDGDLLSKVYAELTGVIRATQGQARKVIEMTGRRDK